MDVDDVSAVATSLPEAADPVAAELEAALKLRRSGASTREVRHALLRVFQLLDE